MSPMGHKRTFRHDQAMSALPLKADIRSGNFHGRYPALIEVFKLLQPLEFAQAHAGGRRRSRR
jgi:hypothetical protein